MAQVATHSSLRTAFPSPGIDTAESTTHIALQVRTDRALVPDTALLASKTLEDGPDISFRIESAGVEIFPREDAARVRAGVQTGVEAVGGGGDGAHGADRGADEALVLAWADAVELDACAVAHQVAQAEAVDACVEEHVGGRVGGGVLEDADAAAVGGAVGGGVADRSQPGHGVVRGG